MEEYKLSASLKGHDDDVRAVSFMTPQAVLSASRDATVRVWRLTSSTPPAYDDSIAMHGSAFINSVATLPSSKEYPAGLIISGGKDAIIDVREPGRPPDANAERMLLGHEGNVCALDVCLETEPPYVVSGSWDASARIWDITKGENTATLEGHEGSVWAVLAYDKDTVVTGCADKLIRVFTRSGKLSRTIRGSSDVVRALCKLPKASAAHFASAGNDAVIRLWTMDGNELARLQGHENFIYSLASLPTGELASSSEDRTLRIWKDSHCVQTITHPAISVWSVAACSQNGDIATGASDRIVRIFSRSKDRQADASVLRAFDDSVRSSSIPQQAMGDVNKERLPGPEFLQQKSGTKEGQVQMIREGNGNISAHQWSTAAGQWLNVGTVVDTAGSSGRKQEYLGQDYDYVFDVDIEESKPPLKLPFNLSQNPYEAAQKFIGSNELPITYIDQVANFIITNTQGATLGQQSTEAQPTGADPWGQEARYRPGETNGSTAPVPPHARPKVLPQKDYLTITTANFSAIQKKILEVNDSLLKDGRKDLAFSPGDVQSLPTIIKQLEAALSSGGKPTTTPVLNEGINLAAKIVTSWPPPTRIAGMDLYRCLAAATPEIVSGNTTAPPLDVLASSGALSSPAGEVEGAGAPSANTAMLALRALANLFSHPEGRGYAVANFERTRALVGPHAGAAANRNVHIAITTLYINYAVQFASASGSQAGKVAEQQVVDAHAEALLRDLTALLLEGKVVDSEVVYRALVAVGTLVSRSVSSSSSKPLGDVVGRVRTAVDAAGSAAKEPRIKGVVEEIRVLLG